LELQINDLQSTTQDAEAAAEKIERQRRAIEADLQVFCVLCFVFCFVLFCFVVLFFCLFFCLIFQFPL
jgi:t-SNARE complex subunit (syntaxin)